MPSNLTFPQLEKVLLSNTGDEMKRVAIIGIGMTKIGVLPQRTVDNLTVEVFKKALSDAKIKKNDLDGLFLTHENFTAVNEKIRGGHLAEYLGMTQRSLATLECGGISSALAVKYAASEILLGRNDINMVIASEREEHGIPDDLPSVISSIVTDLIALYGPYDGAYGITGPLPFYAMGIQRYMNKYGIKPEQIAQLPVILRENASKNPNAHFREKISLEDVFKSRVVSPPVHFLECCPWSDGAAAVILASEEKAKKLSSYPVWITGIGEYHDDSHFIPKLKDITSFPGVQKAAQYAYKDAQKKPEDIDVAEIYGTFAGTEMMIYEDLGFFKKGEAPQAIEKGVTKINGEITCNPSGGRLSLGHPPYVTPLLEIIEIVL